jgi:hypothetical protein
MQHNVLGLTGSQCTQPIARRVQRIKQISRNLSHNHVPTDLSPQAVILAEAHSFCSADDAPQDPIPSVYGKSTMLYYGASIPLNLV